MKYLNQFWTPDIRVNEKTYERCNYNLDILDTCWNEMTKLERSVIEEIERQTKIGIQGNPALLFDYNWILEYRVNDFTNIYKMAPQKIKQHGILAVISWATKIYKYWVNEAWKKFETNYPEEKQLELKIEK